MPTGMSLTPRQSRDILQSASQASALLDRSSGSDCVELIRVVQDSRLGGLGGSELVMHSDRVQELRTDLGFECGGAVFDQAQAEVDVTEEPALVRDRERRA